VIVLLLYIYVCIDCIVCYVLYSIESIQYREYTCICTVIDALIEIGNNNKILDDDHIPSILFNSAFSAR
jgi:hypothetical protein